MVESHVMLGDVKSRLDVARKAVRECKDAIKDDLELNCKNCIRYLRSSKI